MLTGKKKLAYAYVNATSGAVLDGWYEVPMPFKKVTSAPELVRYDDTRVVLFAREPKGSIAYTVLDLSTGSWSSWTTIPGKVKSSPTATVVDGVIYLVALNAKKLPAYTTIDLDLGETSEWTQIGNTKFPPEISITYG